MITKNKILLNNSLNTSNLVEKIGDDEKVIVVDNIKFHLENIIKKHPENKIYILVDENSYKYCYSYIEKTFATSPNIIEIESGEKNKNIDSANKIWNYLSDNGADRNSLMINLGGGVITDIGGFVASTFKRGISFINLPSTLLSQVDASIGAKVGINFNNLKNQIGLFSPAEQTIIFPKFLKTLSKKELTSGFAEVVKHALIYKLDAWEELRRFNLKDVDNTKLFDLVVKSTKIKHEIILQDPKEKGIRKALNFGHTFGHALETYFHNKGVRILHGEAVAIGMICEVFVSNKVLNFDLHKMFEIVEYIAINFKSYTVEMQDYDEIYSLMKHDKKNSDNKIRFALLSKIGEIKINQTCEKNDIFQALNFYYQLKK